MRLKGRCPFCRCWTDTEEDCICEPCVDREEQSERADEHNAAKWEALCAAMNEEQWAAFVEMQKATLQ